MAGGTTVHTYQLAKALAMLNTEVHVVTAKTRGAQATEIKDGIYIHRVLRPYTIFSAIKVRSLLGKIDIIHGHGTCTYGHLKLNTSPVVVKMHNTWLAEYDRYNKLSSGINYLHKIAMRYYIKMDRYCATHADHIICISNAIARETSNYGVPKNKITVIHNGIDYTLFKRAEDCKNDLGLTGLVIGYIGRLEPHKNVATLIRVFKELDYKDVDLLIVGNGTQRKQLEELSKRLEVYDRVHFIGYVNFDRVPLYYRTADIIVYPSLYEPLGNVILESMASGRPIIATNTGGIPEIFDPRVGFMVSPYEPSALREKLNLLLGDAQMRRKMGSIGQKLVRKYSWESVAKMTLRVCEKVLAST
jgi:glycosyltransferase involved in cell wall biosynthesis